MDIRVVTGNTKATLSLSGRFDFSSHRAFKDAYHELVSNPQLQLIEVDFEKVEYLDSSALGMLLVLREKMVAVGKKVELTSVQGTVNQVLEIANFKKLFAIR
ncbi:MAG: STAS domain-containing protein [Pseudomonadota bacterium]